MKAGHHLIVPPHAFLKAQKQNWFVYFVLKLEKEKHTWQFPSFFSSIIIHDSVWWCHLSYLLLAKMTDNVKKNKEENHVFPSRMLKKEIT